MAYPDTLDPFEIAARRFENPGVRVWLDDPVGFAQNCIDWPVDQGLTDYQQQTLADLATHHRVAVRGPHGLGKTTTNAIAVLWFALTRDAGGIDWKVVTTAGAWRQLEYYLWPEIHKWAARLRWDVIGRRPFLEDKEILKLSLKLTHGQAFAVASSKKELIEGAHGDALLYIFDESKSINADIFDAAEGAFSGAGDDIVALALAQSTPGEPTGRFFDIHTRKPGLEDWKVRHVTLAQAVAAKRVSASWAGQRKLQWGADSALYANRVLGEFHSSDTDSVIPLSWVELANERWHEWDRAGRPAQPGRRVFGVDVARGGSDRTIVALRVGSVVHSLTHLPPIADTVAIAHQLRARMVKQTDLAVVDVIGVGAGVVDTLRHTPDVSVFAFNASKRSARRDRSGELKFLNQRAAMWWQLRELLDPTYHPTLCLPPDEDLLTELVAPKWKLVGKGIIQVEGKDEIRTRIGRSTDLADAVAQSLITDVEFNDVYSSQDEANQVHMFAYGPTTSSDAGISWWDWNDDDGFTAVGPEFYEFTGPDFGEGRDNPGTGDWLRF